MTDTGVGIPAAHMGRLFLPFERLSAAESDVEGTGLGLALSKGLVESMGGHIGVESEPGIVSTFWVELEMSEEQIPSPAEPPAAEVHRPGNASLRILYVEDNLPNLRLVEQVVARRYQVEMIPTLQGGMALDLAKQHHPDVVLLDLHLPDIPGEEVLERLRADPATAGIPVVVISADATPKRISRLMSRGAAGYVTKPLNVRRFLELIDDALTRGEVTLAGDPAAARGRPSPEEGVRPPESGSSAKERPGAHRRRR